MTIAKTEDLLREVRKLPSDAKRILRQQEARFLENWLDPRLHIKKLKDFESVYSFRVTRRYRALFYFGKNEAVFFAIGHRKGIYRR